MYPVQYHNLGDRIGFYALQDERFRVNRLAIYFGTKLDKERSPKNAILPFLWRKGGVEYPDIISLNQKLQNLYGASIHADIFKLGDNQLVGLQSEFIDEKYTLHHESLLNELAQLLMSLIFNPKMEENMFLEKDFALERDYLLDVIAREFNEKRLYALNRLKEIMLEGDPSGLRVYGTDAQVRALTKESVSEAYFDLLKQAEIQIFYVGASSPQPAIDVFAQTFSKLERTPLGTLHSLPYYRKETKRRETVQGAEVVQAKLVMGFSQQEKDNASFMTKKMLVEIFGGMPTSKLFQNVREKMSLCYYCSTSFNRFKNVMIVESGVEEGNVQMAVEAIEQQLKNIQMGEVSQEEFSQARLSLLHQLSAVADSAAKLEYWYLSNLYLGLENTPQDCISELEKVTVEDVISLSKGFSLDTIYVLKKGDNNG